jgi:ADP-heptose:LPS heptosyltransferase
MELSDIKKILVVDLGGIGDLLLAQPALRALRQEYPHAVIDALAVGRCAGLIRSYGICNQVYVWDGAIMRVLPVLRNLRRSRYDLVINMRTMISRLAAMKMFILFSCIAGRISAGRDTNGRGFFFAIRVPETEPGSKYEMEYDIDTAAAVGAQVTDRTIRLDIGQDACDTVDRILQERGIKSSDALIAIHPGGMPSRRWPVDRYRKVIDDIHAVCPGVFVIIGGAEEKALANELCRGRTYPVVDTAGALSIQETAALIQRCTLFVSNDTGTMHIAAVVGTPQVAIFGPGQLTRFDPRIISQKAVVLYAKAECAPCNRFTCPSIECLKAVLPQEVVEAAVSLLSREGRLCKIK